MKKLILFIIVIALIIIGAIAYKICFPARYTGELVYVDNLSNTYHRSTCQYVKKANIKDITLINSLGDTVENKLRPCKTCNPPSNRKIVKAKIDYLKTFLVRWEKQVKKYDISVKKYISGLKRNNKRIEINIKDFSESGFANYQDYYNFHHSKGKKNDGIVQYGFIPGKPDETNISSYSESDFKNNTPEQNYLHFYKLYSQKQSDVETLQKKINSLKNLLK